MPAVTLQLRGDKALIRDLLKLGSKGKINAALNKGLRAGAKIVQKAAKAKAPVLSGKLRKSIIVRVPKTKQRGVPAITVRTADRETLGIAESIKGYYPAHVEYGHATRGGGHVAAVPYLRGAFDEQQKAAEALIAVVIRRHVDASLGRGKAATVGKIRGVRKVQRGARRIIL